MSASEHTYGTSVLISGENIDSYTAGEDLSAGVGVAQSGDYTVTQQAADAENFTGIAAYDVAAGEQVAVIKRDCEVRVTVSEAVSAGDELIPDGSGGFETVATSGATSGFLVANEGAGTGELVEAEIVSAGGATA